MQDDEEQLSGDKKPGLESAREADKLKTSITLNEGEILKNITMKKSEKAATQFEDSYLKGITSKVIDPSAINLPSQQK